MVREVNISLWESVARNGPERKYFACYCKNISLWESVSVWEAGFLVISLWEGVEVLQGKVGEIIGISWYLGLRCDLFLLSDVPSSVRML